MASYLESAERYAEIERERIRNIINANNNAIGNAPAITQAQTYSVTPTVPSAEKNKGGIIGGIGYLAEKAGAGLVSSVEGIWDFVAGGIADLVGADRWAKRQVENEWFGDWYDTAGDWYNAGSGWKVAGDITGGIGTSIPALAGAIIAGPAGFAGIATTFGIAATSAGGTSLREAYDKTGKLTGKEWAYAGLSGATEGILESVTDVLGMGIGGTVAKLGKVGGKAVAKTAAQNVAKQGIIKTAAKTAGKSFAGEAFEEGMSAILNPQYAKLTYDPNAENATAQEIAYSAFVGGMAGAVMGGGSTAYTEIKSRATANKLINDKTDGEVLTLAEALIKKDDSDPIGTSIMRDVRGAYQELTESLKGTNGEYTTGRQKYLLGRLNLLTTEATLNEAAVASAIYAINNADSIAESLNALGYTDANGNKITYTADQIREGFKTEGLGKRRAVQNALESNPILRMLSVSDAANRLLMDTSAFNEQTLSGRRIQSQKELNDYIEQAPESVKRELGRALGIEDWSAANYTDVNKALASYLGDENNVKAVEKRLALKKEFEAKRDARPLVVGRATAYAAKKDGIRRYKANGNDYAIKKEGDTYTLYDYTDKIASKDLTLAELRRSLSEYDTKHNNAQETTKDTENATKEKTAPEKEAAKPKREKTPVEKSYEIAKSKVAKYDNLSANDQSMIRKIIRQGIALGVREDVIVYAANIAARTHTDVVFNKDMCAVRTKDGKHIRGYANGAYIASEKRFYFNPEAQTTDGFIIHELDHAIRKRVGADGGVTTKIFKKAIDAAGKDTFTEITKRYGTKTDVPKGKFIPGKTETTEQKISKTEDEVEAFYAETALKDKDILKHMLAEKPTLKDRILNFFKGAVSDYASIPELDADAKKYYKQYRKWFAEFEKDQRGTQINTRFYGDGGDVRYSTDKTFSEQLEDVISGTHNPRYDLYVSETPEYLVGLNFPSGPVLMRNSKVNEILKKHEEMSEEILKGVPLALKDPILVLKSKTHPTESVVVVTDVMTSKGEMIVPVWVNQDGSYVDVDFGEVNEKTNFVASAYGRNIKSLLQYANENDGFFYQTEDEKRVKNLLARNGLQLPTPLRISNSTIIIPETAEKSNPFDEKKSANAKDSPDIRYSLPIGAEPIDVEVEETGDLLAIHNLTEQNLLDTLKLGGFPMPSIAIIRKGQEHSKYGDISVVFGKETIDPQASRYNKVYGGDAWTPTYPRIEYKANPKVAKRISDKYYELQSKYGYDSVRAMYAYAHELEDRLNGLKGEGGLLEELYNSTRMMQVYLLDTGKGRIETVKKEIRTEMTPGEIKMNEFFIKELGAEFVDAYNPPGDTDLFGFGYRKNYVKKHEGRIKEAFSKYLVDVLGIEAENVPKILEAQRQGNYAKMLQDAHRFRHEGPVTVKMEDDIEATKKAIRDAADNEQYRAWVDSLFKGAQEKAGIRNSKDYYTQHGNSRSWEQLHFENTIENVIRVMREQVETGGQTIFSGNSIWGVSAKEYKSVDDVRADKERLKTLPEEEYKAIAQKLGNRLEQIAQSIKSDHESNVFVALDDAMQLIVDCVRTCKTKVAMLKYLTTYSKKATLKTVNDIVDLVRDISNMPTGYFEAKPRRAVDFSEIKMVELPESASRTVLDALASRNIPYEIYGKTNADRSFAIDNLKDVAFSLPLTDDKGNPIEYEDITNKGVPYAKSPDMTVGQMRKHIANTTHYKVFSKSQILEDVKRMPMGDLLKAETREQIADSIWQSFNTFKSAEQADSYIHDMAKYILSASMREARVSRTASEESQRRFNSMRPYVQGLTFTDGELEDIRTARGDDGLKKLLGRWGYKARKDGKKHTTPMDVFVTDMAREVSEFGNLEDMNPVDAFLALDEAYEQAKTDVDDKWQSVYEDATDADLESLLQYIEADLRTAYEDLGDKTAFMKELAPKLKNAVERSEYWKAEYDKTNRYSRFARIVEERAKELRDLRKHKFHNMTQAESDTLDASIGDLSKIMYKGVISVKMTRKACAELLLLYRSEAFKNKILLYENDSNPGLYNGAIENYLEILADGNTELLRSLNIFEGVDEEYRQSVNVKKGFSAHELKLLDGVLSYFVNFYKSYGKVYHRGTLVDIDPLAKKFIGIEHENAALKENILLRSVAGKWFAEAFLDPMALMRMADGYAQDGFNTTMLEDLREAKIKATITEMRIMKEYDEFLTKNEKYLRKSSESTVNVRGQEITKMKLIDLYCTTFRKQAWEGLAINGYQYNDTKGNLIRVDGELDAQQAYEEFEVEAAVARLRNEIEEHLTEKDREYITLVEHIYNVESKRLKQERDVERFGFSNVEDGYYYPIRRANRRTNVDKVDIKEELDRVSNASFNKDIVKHARQELSVESADSRLRRHVAAVCQYAHMSATVEAFNRIFNYDIAGNPNRPISVKTETRNAWKQLEHYWIKLIGDAQGVHTKIEGDGIFSYIRGGYAIAMLSANPKVWLTQFSSFAAASGMIDADSIARGLNVATKADVENIGRYCPLAEIRRYENTAALAQGVLDKRGVQRSKGGRAMEATRKFGEWGMKPIGKTDEFVINRLFGACMVEVEKHGGAKIGTEANKIAAGKMLTKLILETQQNAMATERSAAMRSGNEILRTATMFSSDAMKVVGRFFDAAGEVRVLKARAKATSDPEAKAQYDSKLKVAKKKLRKSIGALVVTAAYMAGIAALFKVLYNKWDKEWKEDEAKALTVAKSISVDFIGNMIGGLPLIRDVYTKLFEGYDVDNYAYSAINDVLNSASSFANLLDKNATSEDVARALKSLVYSTSSFTGIPARNMYNVVFGITKRISEPTAYKIDEVFYKHNYKTDLEKYIDQGDTKMADFMLGLLYDTETTELADSTLKSLRELAELGYKVSPRAVSDSVTVDGEEYPISVAEQSAIETEYFSNLKALDRLTSSASYAKLTDEQRHYAVKSVLDVYYKKAVSDVMGTETTKSVLIASVIGAENMGVFAALVKDYEDDLDKKGEKISGTKRKKIIAAINAMPITTNQKILLMYAKGYTPKDGDIRGVSASSAKTRLLNTIVGAKDLTKEQKESLAKACGLTVKNGKIIVK